MRSYYSDPTANTAIANVDRELRKLQKAEAQRRKAQQQEQTFQIRDKIRKQCNPARVA